MSETCPKCGTMQPLSHACDELDRKAEAHSLQRPCSAPLWYTPEELRHYLKALRHYSDEIATELASDYARNLQEAFQKGWEMSQRAPNEKADA